MNAMKTSERIVAFAESYIGVTANAETRNIFCSLIAPRTKKPEYEQRNLQSARQIFVELGKPFKWKGGGLSTCGMVAEGFWALAEVAMPALYKPYVPGTAVTRAIEFAQKHDAWTSAVDQKCLLPLPTVGDYVVIGCRTSDEKYGGIEHAFTLTKLDADTLECESVDGGQVDSASGLQAIKLCKRRFEMKNGHVWCGDRRLYGWVSVDKLPIIGAENSSHRESPHEG